MNNFEYLFDYTLELIWDRYHVKPDETILSIRDGFIIKWQAFELSVYPVRMYNMIAIEFENEYEQEYHLINNEDVQKILKYIINTIQPSKLY